MRMQHDRLPTDPRRSTDTSPNAPEHHLPAAQPDPEGDTVSIYDIDPALVAHADQHMSAVGSDLDVLIQSYLIHRGQTDSAVAFVVLTENMINVLTLEGACEALALAVQRLAERDETAAEPTTGGTP